MLSQCSEQNIEKDAERIFKILRKGGVCAAKMKTAAKVVQKCRKTALTFLRIALCNDTKMST